MTRVGLRALISLLGVCVTTSALAAERPRMVVMGIAATGEKLKSLAESVSEQLLTELGKSDKVEAMGTSDVAAVLGMERQKAVLGCTDNSSTCIAEISAALGAPWMLTGAIGQSGKTTRLDLKLIRARDGKVIFRDGKNIKDESEVYDIVTDLVKHMLDKMDLRVTAPPTATPVVGTDAPVKPVVASLTSAEAPTAATVTSTEPSPAKSPRLGPWIVTGVGVAGIATGAVFLGLGSSLHTQTTQGLKGTPTSPSDPSVLDYKTAHDQFMTANNNLTLGGIIGAAGVLAAAGGVAWLLLGAPEEAKVSGIHVMVGPTALIAQGAF